MIITAEVDLSESGKRPDLSEDVTKVVVFDSDTYDFSAGLAALENFRLAREGHVFKIDIHPAMGRVFSPFSHYARVGDDGEVIS